MVKESIPKEGQDIKIQSYKHDGNIHAGLGSPPAHLKLFAEP